MERSVILAEQDVIELDALPEKLRQPAHATATRTPLNLELPDEGISLEQLERDLIAAALHKTHWSIKKSAELLGITYKTLQYRIQKYHLKDSSPGRCDSV